MNIVKILLVIFAIIIVLSASCSAYSQTTSCEFIKENDKRNFCRALTTKLSSWCEFIKNNSLKIECRVIIKNEKSRR